MRVVLWALCGTVSVVCLVCLVFFVGVSRCVCVFGLGVVVVDVGGLGVR